MDHVNSKFVAACGEMFQSIKASYQGFPLLKVVQGTNWQTVNKSLPDCLKCHNISSFFSKLACVKFSTCSGIETSKPGTQTHNEILELLQNCNAKFIMIVRNKKSSLKLRNR